MSIRVMDTIWKSDAQFEPSELLVLLALADWSDEDGYCYPSIPTLAKKSRQSERNSRYIIRKLQARGIISVEEHRGRNNTNLYRINLQCFKSSENLQPSAENLQPSALKPAIAIAPEPSLNRQNNRHSSVSAKPAETATINPIKPPVPFPVVPKSIIDTDDTDKPARKKWEPRTEWARYLAANAKYGRSYWEGFASSTQRTAWETLEGTHGDKFKGAIDWAIQKRIRRGQIAERIMKAVEGGTPIKEKKYDEEIVVKGRGFYV